MAGIYVHIPFCKSKCPYCNLFSLASQKKKDAFLQALNREIALVADYLSGQRIETVYFGGGTPSLYQPANLQQILDTIADTFSFTMQNGSKAHDPPQSKSAITGHYHEEYLPELSIELNPDDVTGTFVSELKKTSFNRISLGVQSFNDEELKYLKRIHTVDQSLRAIRMLKDQGFDNISIDLIYGIPGSTGELWKRNLEVAFSLEVPHISAYALTVESGTALAWMIQNQRTALIDEELMISQYQILTRTAAIHGFEHYEISNFALPGWYSRHNTGYWHDVHYLGLGPSAHSYNGTSRRWNVNNLTEYLHGVSESHLQYEEETLTLEQKYNEYIMTSLRTMWGCNSDTISRLFSKWSDAFKKKADSLTDQGLVYEFSGVYYLTEKGKLFADRIASDLFVT